MENEDQLIHKYEGRGELGDEPQIRAEVEMLAEELHMLKRQVKENKGIPEVLDALSKKQERLNLLLKELKRLENKPV